MGHMGSSAGLCLSCQLQRSKQAAQLRDRGSRQRWAEACRKAARLWASAAPGARQAGSKAAQLWAMAVSGGGAQSASDFLCPISHTEVRQATQKAHTSTCCHCKQVLQLSTDDQGLPGTRPIRTKSQLGQQSAASPEAKDLGPWLCKQP
eukprot:1146717-Pelagomonas_calceolata.AAC.6